MGFFIKLLQQKIQLPPQYFTNQIEDEIRNRIHELLEGTCTGRYGYIVAILSVEDIEKGTIIPTTGWAEFDVSYHALLFRPIKNEVLDGEVQTVNKMGIFLQLGPLTVFISSHGIPSDVKFDPNANPPAYISEDQAVKIDKGSQVRVRIVGTRVDSREFFAIGTIKDDFLGLIQADTTDLGV